jgi:hypothetical protein
MSKANKKDKKMIDDLVAKPVVKGQFWIITNGNKKVGNITANNAGYGVDLDGTSLQFKNTNEIKNNAKIKFEPLKTNKIKAKTPYPEYPTTPRVYNSMFDVKRGLHLYTKSEKSKCFHAAGWFVIEHNGEPQISFCPKFIFIQRYPFAGPFKTKEEAQLQINI